MSSLLESRVASQASSVNDVTSGAVARASDPASLPASEVAAVASGTTYQGGRRRKRSAKRRGRRQSQRRSRSRRQSRSRSYRRPLFML